MTDAILQGTGERPVLRFERHLGRPVDERRVYLTGGASAVLIGWRKSTIDIDLQVVDRRWALARARAVLLRRVRYGVAASAF